MDNHSNGNDTVRCKSKKKKNMYKTCMLKITKVGERLNAQISREMYHVPWIGRSILPKSINLA